MRRGVGTDMQDLTSSSLVDFVLFACVALLVLAGFVIILLVERLRRIDRESAAQTDQVRAYILSLPKPMDASDNANPAAADQAPPEPAGVS